MRPSKIVEDHATGIIKAFEISYNMIGFDENLKKDARYERLNAFEVELYWNLLNLAEKIDYKNLP